MCNPAHPRQKKKRRCQLSRSAPSPTMARDGGYIFSSDSAALATEATATIVWPDTVNELEAMGVFVELVRLTDSSVPRPRPILLATRPFTRRELQCSLDNAFSFLFQWDGNGKIAIWWTTNLQFFSQGFAMESWKVSNIKFPHSNGSEKLIRKWTKSVLFLFYFSILW